MRHEVIEGGTAVVPVCPREVTVFAAGHPLRAEVQEFRKPEGLTIAEIVDQVALASELRAYTFVAINGERIPEDCWHLVKPKAGAHVLVKVVPKGPIIPLLMIAAQAFSAAIGSFLLGSTLASTVLFGSLTLGTLVGGIVISTVGMLLMNAIAAPHSSSATDAMSNSKAYTDNPVYSISGGGNSLAKWNSLPIPFGTYRAFPPLGAQYYTEITGNDQYLRMVVVWGYGPLEISGLQIGDTPIEQFDGVQVETVDGSSLNQPVTLYPGSVFQENLSIEVSQAGGAQVHRSAANADMLSVELVFPRGLLKYAKDGTRQTMTVHVRIEYRRVGVTEWTLIGNAPPTSAAVSGLDAAAASIGLILGQTIQGITTDAGGIPIDGISPEVVRHGFRWNTGTRGQYEVQITRLTADSNDSQIADQLVWTALQTFTNDDPLHFPVPVAKTALVIKASDQLNGVVSNLNGVIKMIAPDWDAGTGTWITRATQNPAACFRRALQFPGNFQPQPDSAIDLQALQDWAVWCNSKGFKFNQYRDYSSATWDLLHDICTAGRATPVLSDGKWSVVWDAEQSTPVQYFTPRNSWNFKGQRQFNIVPHAYRIQFANERNGYAVDERVVYRSGYDASNATVFEQMNPIGITDPDQIYRHAQFMFAQAMLRPETWSVSTDFENLVCKRGSLVNLQHDVVLIGMGSARIRALDMSGSNIVGMTCDNAFTMEAGKSYAIEVRTASNAKVVINLTTVEGKSTTFAFAAPAPAPIAVGDLLGFGIAGQVSAEALVTRISRGEDFSATVTMLPYSRDVYSSDTGTIPPYLPTLTPLQTIEAPTVTAFVSDETVLLQAVDGTLVVRCQVIATPIDLQGAVLAVRIRPAGTFAPFVTVKPDRQSGGTTIFSGVNQGEIYDISARWEAPSRLPGPWSTPFAHTIVGKSSPPPPVDNVVATLLSTGDCRVTWEYENPPLDWFGVNIYVNGAKILSEITGYSVIVSDQVLKAVGVFNIEVRSLDTSGNEGAGVIFAYTRPAPDPVESIAVTRQADGSHVIAWVYSNPLTSGSTFEISIDGEVVQTGVPGLSIQTPNARLRQVGTHIVRVVVIDIVGLRSDPIEYAYLRELPPDVTNFNQNAVGANSYFSWDASPAIDIDYYRIKFSPLLTGVLWSTAADFIAKVSAPATTAQMGSLNGTFLIKAVDKDGNESDGAALIETNIDQVADTNFVAEIEEAPDFAGTKLNTVVVGSTLELDSNDTISEWVTLASVTHMSVGDGGIQPSGVYTFANRFDLGDVFTCRLAALMEIEGVDLTDTMSTWPTLASQRTLGGANEDAWRSQLQVRTTKDDPAGSPTWSDWSNFVVGDYTMRAAEFRLLLWSDLGTVTPSVSSLKVTLDMLDRILSDNDVSVGTGGLTITYDGAFRVPPTVGISAQGLQTGDYYTLTAKSETGFTIRFFNASNVGVARTFDWIAKGYGRVAT